MKKIKTEITISDHPKYCEDKNGDDCQFLNSDYFLFCTLFIENIKDDLHNSFKCEQCLKLDN